MYQSTYMEHPRRGWTDHDIKGYIGAFLCFYGLKGKGETWLRWKLGVVLIHQSSIKEVAGTGNLVNAVEGQTVVVDQRRRDRMGFAQVGFPRLAPADSDPKWDCIDTRPDHF